MQTFKISRLWLPCVAALAGLAFALARTASSQTTQFEFALQVEHADGTPYLDAVTFALSQDQPDGSIYWGFTAATPNPSGVILVSQSGGLVGLDLSQPVEVEVRDETVSASADLGAAHLFFDSAADGKRGRATGSFVDPGSGIYTLALRNIVLAEAPLFGSVTINAPGGGPYPLRLHVGSGGFMPMPGDTIYANPGVTKIYSWAADGAIGLSVIDESMAIIYNGRLVRGGNVTVNPGGLAELSVIPSGSLTSDVFGLYAIPSGDYVPATSSEAGHKTYAWHRLSAHLSRYKMGWQGSPGRFISSRLEPGSYIIEYWLYSDIDGASQPFQPSYSTSVTLTAGQSSTINLP